MKNFNTVWDHEYQMESNGMFVGLNAPKALSQEEFNQSLPPYEKRQSFLVDEYPGCPKNWMQSEGNAASYFVPIKEGNGMWLDFNKNSDHTHEVAILVSVQGVNPLTGLQCEDAQLEQYIHNCPKCETPFKPNRFCEECDMNYPKQNYISTTGTPSRSLWLDGFRSVDGVVRQYILTQEKMKGVANSLIGDDRVYAIGVSFFLSKKEKDLPVYSRNKTRLGGSNFQQWGSYSGSSSSSSSSSSSGNYCGDYSMGLLSADSLNCDLDYGSNEGDLLVGANMPSANVFSVKAVSPKKLEVGAGAKINQKIYDDTKALDFWRDSPESLIYINYVLEEDAQNIISQGEISLEGNKEGFLAGIPLTNVSVAI
jgi:hypothetical protein